MELALGFIIAFVIAITGVGAGTITAPLLILFLHVPIVIGVGTALAYSVVVKAVVVPLQMWRRQVAYRVLGIMLLGGLPGVVLGSSLFHHFAAAGNNAVLYRRFLASSSSRPRSGISTGTSGLSQRLRTSPHPPPNDRRLSCSPSAPKSASPHPRGSPRHHRLIGVLHLSPRHRWSVRH